MLNDWRLSTLRLSGKTALRTENTAPLFAAPPFSQKTSTARRKRQARRAQPPKRSEMKPSVMPVEDTVRPYPHSLLFACPLTASSSRPAVSNVLWPYRFLNSPATTPVYPLRLLPPAQFFITVYPQALLPTLYPQTGLLSLRSGGLLFNRLNGALDLIRSSVAAEGLRCCAERSFWIH